MTLVSIPLMDKTGRRTLHLYGLGGMFIFSIFITISFLIKASLSVVYLYDFANIDYTTRHNGIGVKQLLFDPWSMTVPVGKHISNCSNQISFVLVIYSIVQNELL